MQEFLESITLFDWSIKEENGLWRLNAIVLCVAFVVAAINLIYWLVEHRLSEYSDRYTKISLTTKLISPIAPVVPFIGMYVSIQFPGGWSILAGVLTVILPLFFLWEGDMGAGLYSHAMEFNYRKDQYRQKVKNYGILYRTYLED